jgi:predicted nucleic acid-binding protein
VLIQRVFVDANVLYSRTLRDWLFLLRRETGGMFQIHTTEDVLAETAYRLRRSNPTMPGGVITDLRAKITSSIDELVGDFDATIPYTGADPDDRHVHAAAVASRADILLTEDGGFTGSDDDPYEVFSCDEFFLLVDDSAGWLVQNVTADQNAYWAARTGPRKTLAGALQDAGCPLFAQRVEAHLQVLSGVGNRRTRRAQGRPARP